MFGGLIFNVTKNIFIEGRGIRTLICIKSENCNGSLLNFYTIQAIQANDKVGMMRMDEKYKKFYPRDSISQRIWQIGKNEVSKVLKL
jgi:hypothetical protein